MENESLLCGAVLTDDIATINAHMSIVSRMPTRFVEQVVNNVLSEVIAKQYRTSLDSTAVDGLLRFINHPSCKWELFGDLGHASYAKDTTILRLLLTHPNVQVTDAMLLYQLTELRKEIDEGRRLKECAPDYPYRMSRRNVQLITLMLHHRSASSVHATIWHELNTLRPIGQQQRATGMHAGLLILCAPYVPALRTLLSDDKVHCQRMMQRVELAFMKEFDDKTVKCVLGGERCDVHVLEQFFELVNR